VGGALGVEPAYLVSMSDASTTPAVPAAPEPDVTDPAKLIRLGTMVQLMLAEVGDATQDEAGRKRLAEIHSETIEELSQILSEDLRNELMEFNQCCAATETPTAGEIRVAQAQLVGWMQGLLRGMQASAQAQQAIAQQQIAMAQMAAQQQQGRQPIPGGPPGAPMVPPPARSADGSEELPGYL